MVQCTFWHISLAMVYIGSAVELEQERAFAKHAYAVHNLGCRGAYHAVANDLRVDNLHKHEAASELV